MDTSALRTLNALTPLRSHFQSRACAFGSSSSSPQILRSKFHSPLASSSSFSFSFHRLSPLCSLSENVNGNALPPGVGEAVAEFSKKILHVVLVSPQIPGNTGSIARTCAASAVGLHLVGPLGFPVDDAKLKRAGLDYWPDPSLFVVVKVHGSWTEFRDYFEKQEGEKRLLAFTKRGTTIHSEFSYRKGDYLLFGSETKGLPPEALVDCKSNSFGGGTIRIPMVDTYVRCLNLSVSVGISIYEASRQLNYEQLQNPSESSIDGERCFNTEDIFA